MDLLSTYAPNGLNEVLVIILFKLKHYTFDGAPSVINVLTDPERRLFRMCYLHWEDSGLGLLWTIQKMWLSHDQTKGEMCEISLV